MYQLGVLLTRLFFLSSIYFFLPLTSQLSRHLTGLWWHKPRDCLCVHIAPRGAEQWNSWNLKSDSVHNFILKFYLKLSFSFLIMFLHSGQDNKRHISKNETVLQIRSTESVVAANDVFIFKWQSPLVAVVIMTVAEEKVMLFNSNKVHIWEENGVDRWANKILDFQMVQLCLFQASTQETNLFSLKHD